MTTLSNKPLLTIKNLSIEYELRDRTFVALDDFNMTIDRGDIVGIIGESGAGKSTIGKAMLGLLDENASIAKGIIELEDTVISNQEESFYKHIRGKRIGYIYQNPMTALNPVLTIGEQLLEMIERHTTKRGEEAKAYALQLLENAEVQDAQSRLDKYPHQMSGGLCQRIVFAIAIASNPDLIIADEPTTALDVTVQKAVLGTLKNMAKQHQIAIMLITHDMGVVSEMCDYVYVLRYGKLLEHNHAQQIFTNPQVAYTKTLMSSIPRADRKIDRFDVPTPFEAHDKDRATAYLKADHQSAQDQGDVMLSVQNLSKTFVKKKMFFGKADPFQAVKQVSFEVTKGETLGIIGESGSGKSTVGRMILGLYQADDGAKILYRGKNINEIQSPKDRLKHCLSLQCIFQDPYSSLNPRMSAADNITYALQAHGLLLRHEAKRLAKDLMALVGLKVQDASKKPHHFSGGERQRIGIARALSFRPDFLFCDEPTSALDVTVQAELLNLMKDLQQDLGLTMLFVSHDLAVVRQMCNRVMVMRAGEMVEMGEEEQIFTNPSHPYTQQLLDSMPRFNF